MSVFQRLALAGVMAAGIAGASSDAQAQYYYQQSPYGYYQQPAPYVSPKILRKQRQLEQRVYEKYGYPQQQYGYPQSRRYRQNSYDYGYQQPREYRPNSYDYQYQPRYRQSYPQYYQ